MKYFSLVALLGAVLVLMAGNTLAEDEAPAEHETWRRFEVGVGGFFNAVDSNVMLGAEGLGVNISVEELLGLEANTTVFHLAGSWRYTENRRHKLSLNWFAVHRNAGTVLDRNIDLGDTLFLEGTEISSTMDIDIIQVGYSYSILQDDRVDLALSGGLFLMPIQFEASATQNTTRAARSADITAPLPMLGFSTDVALNPRWHLRSSFQLFYIEIGDFTGAISDLLGVVEYNPYNNLGFGLGFESFGLSVEAKDSDYPGIDFKGKMDFEYVGLLFYVKGMW